MSERQTDTDRETARDGKRELGGREIEIEDGVRDRGSQRGIRERE